MLQESSYTQYNRASMRNRGKNIPMTPYHATLYRMTHAKTRSARGKPGISMGSPYLHASRAFLVMIPAIIIIAAGCRGGSAGDGAPRTVAASLLRLEGSSRIMIEAGIWDREIGGFWFWPGRGRYGRLRGTRGWLGRIDLSLIDAKGGEIHLAGRLLPLTGNTLRSLDPADASGSFRNLDTVFQGSGFAAYGRDLTVSAVTAPDRALAGTLDSLLRRGSSPRDHAFLLGEEYLRGKTGARPSGQPGATLMERQYIAAVTGPFVSIATERYYFEGGAHGNTALSFLTLDSGSGRDAPGATAIDARDILPAGLDDPAFLEILAKEARRALDLDPEAGFTKAGFFEDCLPPPSDFFVCGMGLGVQYDRYELAPYSFGDFLFIVPWERLEGIADPSFQARR